MGDPDHRLQGQTALERELIITDQSIRVITNLILASTNVRKLGPSHPCVIRTTAVNGSNQLLQ